MKRFVILFLGIFLCMCLNAQILVIKDGKEVKNGSTLFFYAEEIELSPNFTLVDCSPSEPIIINKGTTPKEVSILVEKDNEEDELTWCMLGSCNVVSGKSASEYFNLEAGEKVNLELHASIFNLGEYRTQIAHVTISSDNVKLKFDIHYIYFKTPTLTVAVNNTERLYGEDNPHFNVTCSGFIGDDDESIIISEPKYETTANRTSDVGKYEVMVNGITLRDDKKYNINYVSGSLDIKKAPLKISLSDTVMIYGNQVPNLKINYEGLRNGEYEPQWRSQPIYVHEVSPKSPVGDYRVSLSCDPLNYYVDSLKLGMISIKPASLLVVADDKYSLYGDNLQTLTYSYVGFKNGDTENSLIAKPSIYSSVLKTSSVGEYDILIGKAVSKNYSIKYTNGKYLISQRDLWVSTDNYQRFYGDVNPNLIIHYEGFVNNEDERVLIQKPVATVSANEFSDVGVYGINISEGKARNYDVKRKLQSHLEIKPAYLYVFVDNTSREYYAVDPIFSYKVVGFKNNDTESALTVKPKLRTIADRLSSVGKYPIVASDAYSKNYTIRYKEGTLTIIKRKLYADVLDASRIYGDCDFKTNIVYRGFVNNENIDVLDSLPVVECRVTEKSSVGTYPLVLSGGKDQNYDILPGNIGYLTILPAKLVITANDVERLYFEDNLQFSCRYDGFKNGDNESCLSQSPKMKSIVSKETAAGIYSIDIFGAVSENYDIDYVAGIYTIKKRSLLVKTPDYVRSYGEENPLVELEYTGFVNNENESSIQVLPTATHLANRNSDVGVYKIEISGGLSNNYVFDYSPGTLTINKALQNITWNQEFSSIEVGDQVNLNAVSSSGLPIEYLISDDAVATVYLIGNQSVLDCIKEGVVTIRATQAGNKNYNAAKRVSKVIDIVPTGIDVLIDQKEQPFRILNRTIEFQHVTAENVIVYAINGERIYKGKPQTIKLQSGIYILLVDKLKYKVQVK